MHADLEAGLARPLAEVVRDGVREHGQVDLLEMEGEPAGLGLRDRRDVADQPLERRGMLEDRAEVLVVARVDPVEHRLEPPAHDRERRPQLVRDVGQERAPLACRSRSRRALIALNARASPRTSRPPRSGTRAE